MAPELPAFENPSDFETFVAIQFKQLGYKVNMPEKNKKGYDIEISKGSERIAVQVKNYKRKCNLGQLTKFCDFLDLPLAAGFTSGIFIASNGFSRPALTSIESDQPGNLSLATCTHNGLEFHYRPKGTSVREYPGASSDSEVETETRETKYFGIFTCKGGVGKTTVAAHLAGAMALQGYDAALLDLDPDQNLKKLFLNEEESEEDDQDASIYVPSPKRGKVGATITVYDINAWRQVEEDIKVVICDCSPVLTENPRDLIEKFDYCVIPTTLNPLGIAKNAGVIIRTFEHIRAINTKADMFVLLNCYNNTKTLVERNEILLTALDKKIKDYQRVDPKCQLIHPDYAKISRSDKLLYWGYHIVDNSKPQLAFTSSGGRCAPRTDFLQLAEYLEDQTSIRDLLD
jgi:chromosome partitioning protein